jgi:hypothetical protein
MSRITKADRVRDVFLDALRSQGASVETMADLAPPSRTPKKTQNRQRLEKRLSEPAQTEMLIEKLTAQG